MFLKAAKYIGAGAAALFIWSGIVVCLAFFAAPGASVAAFTLPGRAAEVAVDAGGSLEEFTSMMVITRSAERGFVGRLYGEGAFLVIDARVVSGCRAVLRSGRQAFSFD